MRTQPSFFRFALLVASLLWPAAAGAVEFSLPSIDTRLHTLMSSQPGAEWNTGANGASGGELAYSSAGQQLTLAANLDVLNYFDPNGGAAAGVTGAPCTTDAGSNCAYNFTNDPAISVAADLDSILITDFGGGIYQVDLNFESTGGTDITITDDDSTVLLTASWQAGTFQSFPTTGLTVSAIYDAGNNVLIGDPTALGFGVITGGAYAQIFDSGGSFDISLHLAEFFNFVPTTSTIAAAIITNYISNGGLFVDNSALIDFTADGQGQVFRVDTGDFQVPEPAAASLLGASLALLAARRRRAA
jgi:hypothetical protein